MGNYAQRVTLRRRPQDVATATATWLQSQRGWQVDRKQMTIVVVPAIELGLAGVFERIARPIDLLYRRGAIKQDQYYMTATCPPEGQPAAQRVTRDPWPNQLPPTERDFLMVKVEQDRTGSAIQVNASGGRAKRLARRFVRSLTRAEASAAYSQ